MSDLFDEYPMLIFALESLLAPLPARLYRCMGRRPAQKKAGDAANASEQQKQQKSQ
ncbi:hypothetical protein ACFFYR_03715 [Paraburkholderia dipogonis]|uniref:hypothetical protein n=1 Tax=Paraburkholderia dipogonis TaxID=1211383 RepID=UPI0035EA4699